jgi:hypothetical protein
MSTQRPTADRRRRTVSMLVAALAAAWNLWAASATLATTARPIATLPGASRSVIRDVSTDGSHLLVETSEGSGARRSLWTVDSLTGAAKLLMHPPANTVYRQSPDGAFVGWAEQGHGSTAAYVARTDAATPPQRLVLPVGYSHAGVLQMTVGSSGRVTLLVSDKPVATGPNATAVLSAGAGETTLSLVARLKGPRHLQRVSVSQDGRVFALCDEVHRQPGDNGETAEVTAISSEPEIAVKHAAARFSLPGTFNCSASDAGTATMMVSQHVPGSGTNARQDFRSAVVTTGLHAGRPLVLAPGTGASELEAVSPSGSQAILSNYSGTALTILSLASGRQKVVRLPALIRRLGGLQHRIAAVSGQVQSFPVGEGLHYIWDEFADAVEATIYDRRSEYALLLNLDAAVWAQPAAITRDGNLHTCDLPDGRVLVAGASSQNGGENMARLFVSNPTRTSLSRINSDALGVVDSINCEGAASGHVFLASEGSGVLYEVPASALDGSSLAAR